MQQRYSWPGLILIAMLALSARAGAQQGEPLPPEAPAAPVAPAAPAAPATPATPAAPVESAPPPSADASAAPAAMPTFELCTPACRAGFVCLQGQCASACNPPCNQGEHCTAAAQCERDAVAPALSFYKPEPEILPGKDPTAERHDGFMLRLTLGFGYGGATREVRSDPRGLLGGDGKTKLSGLGVGFSLDIGGAPVDNLVIHGRYAQYNLAAPRIRRRNADLDNRFENGLSAALFAPAVTYYIMPVNVYVTGAIGLVGMGVAIREEDDKAHVAGGFGLNLDVGKEWWVGDQWGLGVAARFWYSHASNGDDDGADADYALTAFAVVFSATYQ